MEETIFELKINKKNRIIAVKCEDYDSVYFDSKMYFIKNNKKKFFVNHSFCHIFGAEMYLRINNIHEYNKQRSYVKTLMAGINYELKNGYIEYEGLSAEELNDIYYSENMTIDRDYVFVYGTQDQAFYLYKRKKTYKLIYIKMYLVKGFYSARVYKKYTLSSEQINEWKQIINSAFERLTKEEGEKEYNRDPNDPRWNDCFERARTEDDSSSFIKSFAKIKTDK